MVGSYYREDLLERVTQAPDTSLERVKRNRGQVSTADISIAAQARTVRINPKYQDKLTGKTVIVFDDFTTEGKSVEWARTLLTSAKAAQVIALTIGKYGASRHTAYQLPTGTTINPHTVSDHLQATSFMTTSVRGTAGPGPDDALKATISHFIATAQPQPATSQTPAPPATAARTPRPAPAGARSPMTSYKNARQQHLGQMLTYLQQQVYPLVWRGEFLTPAGEPTTTALWWIALPGQVEQWYDTREAESLVSGICQVVGVIWEPVAAPGGAAQLAEALARMEQRRQT